jgi:hypothetical protein
MFANRCSHSPVTNVAATARVLEFGEDSTDIYSEVYKIQNRPGAVDVKKGDSFKDSLFPELDEWIRTQLKLRPGGHQAYLRAWMLYKSSDLLVYSIGGSRYCESVFPVVPS